MYTARSTVPGTIWRPFESMVGVTRVDAAVQWRRLGDSHFLEGGLLSKPPYKSDLVRHEAVIMTLSTRISN